MKIEDIKVGWPVITKQGTIFTVRDIASSSTIVSGLDYKGESKAAHIEAIEEQVLKFHAGDEVYDFMREDRGIVEIYKNVYGNGIRIIGKTVYDSNGIYPRAGHVIPSLMLVSRSKAENCPHCLAAEELMRAQPDLEIKCRECQRDLKDIAVKTKD